MNTYAFEALLCNPTSIPYRAERQTRFSVNMYVTNPNARFSGDLSYFFPSISYFVPRKLCIHPYLDDPNPSLNSKSITGTLVSKLSQLILSQSSMLLVNVTCLSSLILTSVPPPHKSVDNSAQRDHTERHSVALDISWSVRNRTIVTVSRARLISLKKLTK